MTMTQQDNIAKISMTVEEQVALSIEAMIDEERISKDDPDYRVAEDLARRLCGKRRISLSTSAEVQFMIEELEGRLGTVEDLLGFGVDYEEERDYRMEQGRLRRSIDRLRRQ